MADAASLTEPGGAPAGPGVPAKKPSKVRVIVTAVVGLIVTVAVFALLIPQLGSYEEALDRLAEMPAGWIVALAFLGLLNLALYPSTVMVSIDHLRYWPAFVERQVGFLISNSLPGGGVFAVGAQYRVLALYRVPPTMSAAAVTSDAVWTYLITLGMPSIAVGLLVLEGENQPGLTTLAIIGIAAVIVSVVLITIVLRSENDAKKVGRQAIRIITPVMRKFHKPVPDVEAAVVGFRLRAHDLIVDKWKMLTLTNVVTQLMPFFIVLCALGGLGAFPSEISLIEVFGAYAVAQLLVSIPITPGGLGTVDAALIALLTTFGVDSGSAVAADLLWRLVWFLPQMLAGVVAMAAYLLKARRTTKAAQAA